jgi:transcriptional regulator with XRE-family HTH domain
LPVRCRFVADRPEFDCYTVPKSAITAEATVKKVIPDGSKIKTLRTNAEHVSTQKELAYEVRVSERTLREIENKNAPVTIGVLDRLAKILNVRREQISFPCDNTLPEPPPSGNIFSEALAEFHKECLVPRYDYDLANVTMDEGLLFKQANSSNDFACEIMISLTDEAAEYTQELVAILDGLTWSVRSILEKVSPSEEIAIRRRIKKLLVLLRGNDVWVYHTHLFRRLPERHTPLPEGEYADLSSRFIIALAAPAEWGETSIRVPIDHGQPFILPALNYEKKGGKD